MKYTNILQVLAVETLELHSGVFGSKKPFAKLTEEDLEKLDKSLAEPTNATEIEALKQRITELENENAVFEKTLAETTAEVEKAIETAGLEKQSGLIENISHLGAKCKEYGESSDRHTFAENNGKEEPTDGLIENYINPNDEHNQLLKDL